jgi:hypothetical protein
MGHFQQRPLELQKTLVLNSQTARCGNRIPLDGTEPIDDDEFLYRRIPVSQNWYDPTVDSRPSPEAFRPTQFDNTGLSLSRNIYKSIEDAARGMVGKKYYIAVLRVGDLRAEGIPMEPRSKPGDPGHAEIPGLTYENRRTDGAVEWKTLFAQKLCLRVEGPFPSEREAACDASIPQI